MPIGFVSDSTDCNDLDPTVFPNAQEICDEKDNSCNGLLDDDDPALDLTTAATWYIDSDTDGYGDAQQSVQQCTQPVGYVDNAEDCDDSDAAIVPDLIWYLN